MSRPFRSILSACAAVALAGSVWAQSSSQVEPGSYEPAPALNARGTAAPAFAAGSWSTDSISLLDSGLAPTSSFPSLSADPNAIAIGNGLIFAGFPFSSEVIAFDRSGTEQFRWSGSLSAIQGMAFVNGELVIFRATSNLVEFYEPLSGTLLRSFSSTATTIEGLTYDGTLLWALSPANIIALDPSDGTVIQTLPNPASGCSFGGTALAFDGAMLVAGCSSGDWFRIDRSDGSVVATGNNGIDMYGLANPDGRLYLSIDNDSNGLFELDTTTGSATNVGISGVGAGTVGLAPSATPGALFGTQPFDLLEIQADGSGSTLIGGDTQEGLAFDPATGTLYGSLNGAFRTIDPATGLNVTALAAPGPDIEGLAWGNGGVYAIADSTSDLFFYDPGTNSWSVVGATGLSLSDPGLAFDPFSNTLYAKGRGNSNLYRIDPSTGNTTVVGDTGLNQGGGLAFSSGFLAGSPELTITPATTDFGDQEVGTISAAASVTLSNGGTADLDVSSVTAATAPFAVSGGTCGAAPFTVAAGSSCTIDYTFAPTATGAASQTITVTSNSATSPDSFALQGNGIQATLTIAPNPLDFGDQEVGTVSAAASVALSNGGTADLNVSALTAAAAPFAVAGGSCGPAPFTVPAGSSCTIAYTFAPTATGAANQTITVTSNSATSPDSFALQGNGTQATLAIAPNPQDFGDQEVGTVSAAASVALSNGGTADLNVSAVTAASAPFAVAGGSCGPAPFTVAVGASCTIAYTFAPTATGAASQTITVTSNSATSPDSFTLQGNGTEAIVTLDVTSVQIQVDFGGTGQATANVTNDGTADLTISEIAALDPPFSFAGGSCFATPTTLAPAASCSIDIAFDPGALSGTFLDSFDIVSNAASSPDTVQVQGIAADLIAVPTLDRTGLLVLVLSLLMLGGLAVRRSA